MQNNRIWIITFFVVLLLSGCSTATQSIYSDSADTPDGTIFFRTFINEPSQLFPNGYFRSYFVSMPERSIQTVGYVARNVGQAISSDGELFASTCNDDDSSVCILNTSSIIDKQVVVPEGNLVGYQYIWSEVIYRISLPGDCVDLEESHASHQMSWSFDKSKLSIICGSKLTETLLCILEITGESKCYPDTTEKEITYAAWSPNDNSLVVSSTTMSMDPPVTYLFDPEIDNYQILFTGFSPAWSPGGDRIASFIYTQTDPVRYGLQVYSLNEKKATILLPNKNSDKAEFLLWPTVDEHDEECTISWSLDEKQLVFSSRLISYDFSALLLYDFENGNIQFLLDPYLFQKAQLIPQWSSYLLNNGEAK